MGFFYAFNTHPFHLTPRFFYHPNKKRCRISTECCKILRASLLPIARFVAVVQSQALGDLPLIITMQLSLLVLLSITSFLLSKERNPQGLQLLTQVEGHRVHGPWRLGHLGMLLLRRSLRAIILNANVLRQVWNAFCLWGWQMRHGMNLKFELTPLEVKKVKRGSERKLFLLWVTGATCLVIKHKELELVIYEYVFDLSAAETQKFCVTQLHKVVLMTWGAAAGQKQKSSI